MSSERAGRLAPRPQRPLGDEALELRQPLGAEIEELDAHAGGLAGGRRLGVAAHEGDAADHRQLAATVGQLDVHAHDAVDRQESARCA